jgi:GNAT superfamily N-acetyltransferase
MLHIRPARPDEKDLLTALIVQSARQLSRGHYTEAQIEAAVTYVFGVDSELVEDGTYFVVEEDGIILACGGWSRRRTLFGGDHYHGRSSGFLDPATEPAKIRAFFVHPDHARRGIGSALLRHCEQETARHGFTRLEMMATLPGVKLYERFGYEGQEYTVYTAPDGTDIPCLPMQKTL